jgi:hypothetical protein
MAAFDDVQRQGADAQLDWTSFGLEFNYSGSFAPPRDQFVLDPNGAFIDGKMDVKNCGWVIGVWGRPEYPPSTELEPGISPYARQTPICRLSEYGTSKGNHLPLTRPRSTHPTVQIFSISQAETKGAPKRAIIEKAMTSPRKVARTSHIFTSQ